MSLLTDCLAAGGTLGIAVGSGLQAASELKRYGAVANKLGLTDAASSAVDLFHAWRRFYRMVYLLPLSLWPAFSWSIWRSGSTVKQLYNAIVKYYKDLQAIGSKELTEKLTQDDKIAVRELAWKSGYWFLIMVGTLAVFAGSIIGIILDLTQS